MTQTIRRYDTLAAARNWNPQANGDFQHMNITEVFGEYTLTLEDLRERLPKIVWQELKKTVEEG